MDKTGKVLNFKRIVVFVIFLLIVGNTFEVFACTSVLAGKKATKDGSVIIARTEDEKVAWAKYFIVHERKVNKPNTYYKSTDNKFVYLLNNTSYKYTASPDWDTSQGIFEEAGINEFQVGVSATETVNSNQKISSLDPFFTETGITESSIPSVILPEVKTAREGVLLMGKIIEEKGAGEPFGMSIADPNEAWYLECGSGHRWIAVRVPDDSYMVVANQVRITNVNLNDAKNFLGSKDLITFPEKNGLYNAGKGTFSFASVYGTDTDSDYIYNYPRVWWGEKMLTPSANLKPGLNNYPLFLKPDKKLTPLDIMSVFRSHYNGSEFESTKVNGFTVKQPRPINSVTTMESHVLQLRNWLPNPIGGVEWLSLGVPESSPYVRFYSGITDTPKEYKVGTDKYSDNSAYWIFRSIGALLNTHYNGYYPYVVPDIKSFEKKEYDEQDSADKTALSLYKQNVKKGEEYMTSYSNNLANKAMELARDMKNTLTTLLTGEEVGN